VRKVWWALIGALCLLSLFGLATYLGIWNPAIARMKGEVTYVRPVADETRICLSHPVDAGSTYGDHKYSGSECWSGVVEGRPPKVGDCVVLRTQGESSDLGVKPARGCH
jgi:hypothetical protein